MSSFNNQVPGSDPNWAPPSSKATPFTSDGAPTSSPNSHAPSSDPAFVKTQKSSDDRAKSGKGARTPRFTKADFLRNEGPRGVSVRATVWLRHLGYFISIVLGASITQAALSKVPNTSSGGLWMLGSLTVLYVTAVVGSWMFPDARTELIEEARHYAFGITLIPGTSLAILMWAASRFMQSNSSDVFAHTLGIALPIVYVMTVLIPCVLFVRLVAGRRYFAMSRGDDEKAMRAYTRQGYIQP